MSILKVITRKFLSPALLGLGIDRYFLSKSAYSCCIINFHGVRQSNTEVFNNRHLPVHEFEKTIAYLSKRFDIVPLHQVFDMHRSGRKFNKKTVAITFDDGYLNNFEQALPILKKHNVPATFYIISKGLVESTFKVWPDIIDLIQKFHTKDIILNEYSFKPGAFHNTELNLNLLNYLKTLGVETETIVNELVTRLNFETVIKAQNPEYLQLVDKKGLARYKNEALFEFGSHTHSHFNLEYLTADEAAVELEKSKQLIEEITEKQVRSIAFPDGSYNQKTIDVAIRCGYLNLVAVDYKLAENNQHPHVLSRFTISNSTTAEANALRLSRQYQKYGFC